MRVNPVDAAHVASTGAQGKEILTDQLAHLVKAREELSAVQYGYGIRPSDFRAGLDAIERMTLVTRAHLAASRQTLFELDRVRTPERKPLRWP